MGLQPGAGTLERTVPRVCIGCHGSRDSPSNHPGMVLERATASVCGCEMENRKIEISPLEYSTAIRVPPHAPSLLGSQPAQRGANAYPFLLPAYQKTSPQCFRRWVFERTQGIVVTWLPWGAGRGPQTSWIAGRKAQPAGRRVADCTRRGRGCTCAIDAREKSRLGGGTVQTP